MKSNKYIFFAIMLVTFLLMIFGNELSSFLGYGTVFTLIRLLISGKFNRVIDESVYGEMTFGDAYYNGVGEFETYILDGTRMFQIVIIAFAIVAILMFFTNQKYLRKFEYSRECNIRKFELRKLLKYATFVSAAVYLGYVLYLVLGVAITNIEPIHPSPLKTIFLDYLGESFYWNHRILYYLIEGFLRFFIVPFIYSILGCALILISNKVSYSITVLVVFYFGLSVFNFVLPPMGVSYMASTLYFLLSPSAVMSNSAYIAPTIVMLLPLCLPIIISSILVLYRIFNYEV
ncbi:hypothetical protein [Erysipelothrix aquatica]|uniref:hypothetical protein n=1 Tax=Erysipelothrix aquatica TaxID=2683714 RepID=UPI001356A65F|nr:hypothetical protein [Erysipelothrix aquatica]